MVIPAKSYQRDGTSNSSPTYLLDGESRRCNQREANAFMDQSHPMKYSEQIEGHSAIQGRFGN